MKDGEIKSATKEILTFQDRPQYKALEYRWKALRAYEDFIKAHKSHTSDEMADSMQRLADIYMEIEKNTYLRKKDRFDHSRSRELYKEILELYPDRPDNESVLYQLARGYVEEGDWESTNKVLERLTEEFPDGKFTQEAYFRLGEYFSAHGQLRKSVYYYRQVLKKEDYNFYDKALYKSGWVLFQSKDYDGAADKFITLLERRGVRLTPEGKEEVNEVSVVERDMVWDAIRTLVLVFDYMGGTPKIEDYFKTRGIQRYEPYIYRRLGDIYLETGRFKEAADIYEAFINTNPLHGDAPQFQSKVVEAYSQGNMFKLAYDARVKLIDNYREDGIWFKSNRRSVQKRAKDLVKKNKTLVKHDMYQLAIYNYSMTRLSKKEEDYANAVFHMRKFIDIFPQEPESVELRLMLSEVNFLLAEIYFEMKDFGKAATEYEKVAYTYKAASFSAESGYRALLSIEKLAKPSGEVKADNIHVLRLLEGIKDFTSTFPDESRAPEALLNGAEIFFHLGNFEDSRAMAQQLIEHRLSAERERYLAQKLIADSFLKEQAYIKSVVEIKKAISIIPEEDIKDLPNLERALAASMYKEGEELKSQDKVLEAAKAFEDVFRTVPGSDIAPIALFDAGVLFEQAMEPDTAAEMYEILIAKYSDSKYAFDAAIKLGDLRERQSDYMKAALVYDNAAGIAPDAGSREDVLYRAVLMYEQVGDLDNLYNSYYRSYEKFYKEFPESRRLIELTFNVAVNRESIKDLDTARNLYKRVISLNAKLGAGATVETSALAAGAQLILSDYKKSLFEEVMLVNPLEINLEKKKDLLREALTGYTAAAKYRISDITTEATYKMGGMLQHLRDAILESERPGELTPEQLEEYDYLLEEHAYPFEEKAISAYESNVRRTVEAGIYDNWIEKSYKRLSSLSPVRYRRDEVGDEVGAEVEVEGGVTSEEGISIDKSSELPETPEIFIGRGIEFRKNGEFKKAEEEYLKGLSLRHDFSDAFLNLGILYELYMGRLEDALKSYREYVRSGGSREDVLAWIDMIEGRLGKGR